MIFMEAYKIGKYEHIIKLFTKTITYQMLTIEQKTLIFNILKNNLIQKKSINFKNKYKGF